jgi:predicted PurR-regulated permease PerM
MWTDLPQDVLRILYPFGGHAYDAKQSQGGPVPYRSLRIYASAAANSRHKSAFAHPTYRTMGFLDKTTLRVAATLLLLAAVLAFCWLAAKPLLAFLFAILFAYLLEPIVQKVQRWTHRGRGLSVGIVYLALLIALIIFGVAVGPRMASEAQHLSQTAPTLYERVASGNIAWQVGQQRGWSFETQQRMQQLLASHREDFTNFLRSSGARAAALAQNALWIVLIPILAIFFLKGKSEFSRSAQQMVESHRKRELLRGIIGDMDEMLAHYVRAQLYLAAISGAVYMVALTSMRVPYSVVLGAIGGLLEFVPVVGPAIAAVLILGLSFAMNYTHLLWVLIFLGVWRGIQDYVVSPRLLGGRVELHPLAALFGILAGAEIGGVIGVYLAVPLMATIRILWKRWSMYSKGHQIETLPTSEIGSRVA